MQFIGTTARKFRAVYPKGKKNSDLTELTPYALKELVKAVYIEAPDK